MDSSVEEGSPNKQKIDFHDETPGQSSISEKITNFQQNSCSSESIASDRSSFDRNHNENWNESVLRIGLVGHGERGKKFIKAIGAVPRLKLVAICDVRDDVVEKNIPVFKSVDEMIKIPLDVGIVCVPHDKHFEISKQLLEKGIHVFKRETVCPLIQGGRRTSKFG